MSEAAPGTAWQQPALVTEFLQRRQRILPMLDVQEALIARAIHHLSSERKRALFAEVHDLLEPGAMFINMDFVLIGQPLSGLFDEEMVDAALASEHEHGGARSREEIDRALLADDSDDQPDSAEDQLRWLREAGFSDAELHFKWAEAAVFGAVKPEKGSD